MNRLRTTLWPTCAILLLSSSCISHTVTRSAYPPIKPSTLSDYIRGVYKVSSEASKQAQERAALLSAAPELAPLIERAETDPMDTDARSRVVAEYMSRQLYWGAYNLLTNALPDNASDPDMNIDLAFIWDTWGQNELALQYGERAISNGAASAQAFETMGRIRLHRNEPAQAVAWYRRSLEYERRAAVLANMGYALMLMSDWEKARATLEEALMMDDTLAEAHNNLAVLLSRTGDDTGALAQLLQTGRPAAAFNNMGVLYLQERRIGEAQHYFEEALKLEPAYEIARRNLDGVQELMPPLSILHLSAVRTEPLSAPPPVEVRSVEGASVKETVPLVGPEKADQEKDISRFDAPRSTTVLDGVLIGATDSYSTRDPQPEAIRPAPRVKSSSAAIQMASLAGLVLATGIFAFRSRK